MAIVSRVIFRYDDAFKVIDFFATYAICTLRVMLCFCTSSRPQPEYVGAFVGTKIGSTASPRKNCNSTALIQ